MNYSSSSYAITGYRASIHVTARYKSDNGFVSIEDGYSEVGTMRSYNRLVLNAVWNGAYKHVHKGGNYTWQYRILSKKIVYMSRYKLNIVKPKDSKNTVYVKRTTDSGRVTYEDKQLIKADNKKIKERIHKKRVAKQKESDKYVSKTSYKKMFKKDNKKTSKKR